MNDFFRKSDIMNDADKLYGLFVWLVADGWCLFNLREKYCWLVADKCECI
jgi:hypothetical protein